MVIGIDLVDIERIAQSLRTTERFATRVFSAAELALAAGMSDARRAEFLAGRFAVKEAVLKALAQGISGVIELREIETLQRASGEPELRLTGAARRIADERGLVGSSVSISHENNHVVAVAALF